MIKKQGSSGLVLDRRGLLTGAAALGGAALLPGGLRAETVAPRSGGTLRISMPYNPASVDPMTGRNLPDFNVLYAVFDALIDFEPKTLELKYPFVERDEPLAHLGMGEPAETGEVRVLTERSVRQTLEVQVVEGDRQHRRREHFLLGHLD